MRITPETGAGRPQKARIAVLTAASLSWNPRALKEARTLARAGFDVVVFGAGTNCSQISRDASLARQNGFRFESITPVGTNCLSASVWPVRRRVRTRIGRALHSILGLENHWQLGVAAELLGHARKARADYYIAHMEPASWVAVQLIEQGCHLGIDIEDWYSEDLLPAQRKSRPLRLLRHLERTLLTTAAHSTCPSRAMGEALASEFGCPAPTAIYNAFPWSDRKSMDGISKDRKSPTRASIHWFSQTLGEGRGLEDLFAALPLLKCEAEVHLRGNPSRGFPGWLARSVPENWRTRIHIHDLVPESELLSRISEHDIGFAGEMQYCRSRDLTVTNKILQYLLAGLAVVASDTAGQKEVSNQAPGAVSLYRSGDSAALAACLNTLLASPEILRRAKSAALQAAEQTFCWEQQEKKLLEVVSNGRSKR